MGFLAQPAMATNWYSAGSPLNVKSGSTTVGAAYGNYYNKSNTYAASKSFRIDRKAGGNGIFVATRYKFWVSGAWVGSTEKQTGRWTDASWKEATYQLGLNGSASQSRGQIHVCEDQTLSSDPCSAWTYPTFSY